MKICPNCKTELDDNTRFCLCCMTSLDEKEQIPPPAQPLRRWYLVLLCGLLLCLVAAALILFAIDPEAPASETTEPSIAADTTEPSIDAAITADPSLHNQTVNGVCYTFRSATLEDYPSALTLQNRFVLIKAEGIPADGVYRVPTFVGEDTSALVVAVADGAFAGTQAKVIDLGHNVRYVHGNAFGGYPLTDLYLHEDVFIHQAAFSGCTEALTIHCPDYLENTQGTLWSELAITYGFRWQPEAL